MEPEITLEPEVTMEPETTGDPDLSQQYEKMQCTKESWASESEDTDAELHRKVFLEEREYRLQNPPPAYAAANPCHPGSLLPEPEEEGRQEEEAACSSPTLTCTSRAPCAALTPRHHKVRP